jgi:alkanesulfonate monooxygenase
MPVEFIGMIFHRPGSDFSAFTGPLQIDRGFIRTFAQAHEDADFDRVLIGTGSIAPEGAQIAAYAAANTEKLTYLVSHRPGFRAPTVAARELATLDHLSEGRIAVHTITGAHDTEMQRDGDFLDKERRYARTDEYLDIVRSAWTASGPFDYEGEFYRVKDAPGTRTFQDHLPLYFGGSSTAAYRVGAKHADVYALWGEPLAETADQIASIGAWAETAGREQAPRISVSFRPILAATDELAWERAYRILEQTKAAVDAAPPALQQFLKSSQKSVGSERLLAASDKGDRHDRALFTAISKATGAPGNSTALVGSPETVAQALLDYYDIGVTTFLIRGHDPLEDAVDYGRELIPLVREEIRRRDAAVAPKLAAVAG